MKLYRVKMKIHYSEGVMADSPDEAERLAVAKWLKKTPLIIHEKVIAKVEA